MCLEWGNILLYLQSKWVGPSAAHPCPFIIQSAYCKEAIRKFERSFSTLAFTMK